MGQPVKLSDQLVRDARRSAKVSERSIAGQIEFWAQLGRAMEPLLRGDRVIALRRAAADRPLSAAIAEVDSMKGRKRVRDYLQSRPFPHFEAVPGKPGLVRKVEADGTETLGQFVGRDFRPIGS